MKYDLKAMEFDPEKTDIFNMFIWAETPEKGQYWAKYNHNPHQEGRDKIAVMLKQWKEEQAMTKREKADIINLTKAEVQSGLSRVRNAEGLIKQLSDDHSGRNTWLLNYGTSSEAKALRAKHGLIWDQETTAAKTKSATLPEPPRPAINVLHKHDGSDESPLPVGTDATCWFSTSSIGRGVEPADDIWSDVTEYLVHSYPETKQVTGTVTYTNGEPDLSTWTPNE